VSEEFEIDVGWGKLAAVAHGDASGEIFVCLHGWLDNAASFTPLARFLEHDARLVCVDLPGHGKSDHRPKGTSYHLVDSALDVMRFCDALGLVRFSLVGHSLGGALAGLIASSFPERVERLILLESLGPLSSEPGEVSLQLRSFYNRSSDTAKKRKPLYESLDTVIRARRLASELSVESARMLCERGTLKSEGGVTWSSDARLRWPTQRLTEPQVLAFLQKIRCPTLLVKATRGMLQNTDERARALANLTTRLVEGAHHVHMDDAPATTAAIRSWLGR
jgi:pimeloyl-ACP methyl ester carboxylesterase